jgi:hypothetical protein
MTLRNYFQPEGQQRALATYGKFAFEQNWPIREKMDLYEASRIAFDPTADDRIAFGAFERIYNTLAGGWQVFRPHSPNVCWPPRQIFETIRREFSDFRWDGTVNLTNFINGVEREALLSNLASMAGLKPNQGYPIMAVSKFLHFYNPSLFPIYDDAVIWKKVYKRFRHDHREFCSASRLPYNMQDTSIFLRNYLGWASSLLASAHPTFMHAFVAWIGKQPGIEVERRSFAASSLYGTAFEFTAIGAVEIELKPNGQ